MTIPRRRLMGASIVSAALAAIVVLVTGLSTPPAARGAETITSDTLFDWMTKYSNWGRWGKDDQFGTVNFITESKRREAAKLVKLGISVGTARRPYNITFDPQQPFLPAFPNLAPKPTGPLLVDEGNPFFFWPNPTSFTSDRQNFSMAGATQTHLDAIPHTSSPPSATPRLYPERMAYNGIPLRLVATASGLTRYGMEMLADRGVFTKGVLFDATLLAHLREGSNPWLAPGTKVTRADIEQLERIEGVRVESGDVILLYTGRWKRRAVTGAWPTSCTAATPPNCGFAGFWYDNIPFFYEREISQLGADGWNDVTPANLDAFTTLPYHGFQGAMGLQHYDNMDLENLRVFATALHRYEFLFSTNAYPVVGGIIGALNPLAVF